jgi:hypothetical protein
MKPAQRRERHRGQGCGIDGDEPGEEVGSVVDVVAPELDRASALADQLAQLLVPARLFS